MDGAHIAASVRTDTSITAAERGTKERDEVVRQLVRCHRVLRIGEVDRASRNLAIEVVDEIVRRINQRLDRLVNESADETGIVRNNRRQHIGVFVTKALFSKFV